MIKVLIVDDNAIVRKGLTRLLEDQCDMNVVIDAADGISALAILQEHPAIDIVLADFNMPGMDGVELASELKTMNHAAKVIILTMHRHSTFRNKAIAAGAKGFLLKGEDEEELFNGIRAVHAGKTFISVGSVAF